MMMPGITDAQALAARQAMIARWNNAHLPPLKCGGCRACCIGDTIKLQPGEDPAQYKTRLVNGRHELRKGKDGHCVYAGKAGCKIQARKPLSCRLFDCRVAYEHALQMPEGPARDAWMAAPPIERGRSLHPEPARAITGLNNEQTGELGN